MYHRLRLQAKGDQGQGRVRDGEAKVVKGKLADDRASEGNKLCYALWSRTFGAGKRVV